MYRKTLVSLRTVRERENCCVINEAVADEIICDRTHVRREVFAQKSRASGKEVLIN